MSKNSEIERLEKLVETLTKAVEALIKDRPLASYPYPVPYPCPVYYPYPYYYGHPHYPYGYNPGQLWQTSGFVGGVTGAAQTTVGGGINNQTTLSGHTQVINGSINS